MGEVAHSRHEQKFNRLFTFDERARISPENFSRVDTSAYAQISLYSQSLDITRRFGFDEFVIAKLPSFDDFKLLDELLLTSHSPTIVAVFDRLNALQTWPMFDRLRRSNLPFTFTDDSNLQQTPNCSGDGLRRLSEVGSETPDCLRILSAQSGCCIPLTTIAGERAFVLLTGNFSKEVILLAEVALEFARLFEKLVSSTEKQFGQAAKSSLNIREIECLKWAAAGKTSSEIALITTLSEHTINHYLNICCRKLNAVNRVQAVAKAIRLSII